MRRGLPTVLVLVAALGALVAAVLLALGDAPPGDDAVSADRTIADIASPDAAGAERRHVDRVSNSPRAYCDVLLEDGRPAEGATVVVIPPEGPAEHLLTDAGGRAIWRAPREGTTVFAVRDGEACSRDTSVAGEERIVLRLGPGSCVEGTVRWTDGSAAADVVVDMSIWRRGYTVRWVARTDRSGRYAFHGVPPAARVQPQVRQVADCVPVGDTPLLDAAAWGETTTADLVVRRPGMAHVLVEVVLPEGAPAPEACSAVLTGADGVGVMSARRSYDAGSRRLRVYVPAGVATILRLSAGDLSGEVGPFTAADGEELALVAHLHAKPRLVLAVASHDGRAVATDDLAAHLILERDGELQPLGGRPFRGEPRLDVTDLLPMLTALGAPGMRLHVVLDGPGVARGGLTSDRGANLTCDGYDLARLLAAGGDVALTARLHEPLRAVIVTVDADGNVVPDVDVDLLPANGFAPAHVRTGSDGRADVDVLLDTSDAERESAWKRAVASAAGEWRGRTKLEAPESLQDAPEWRLSVVPLRMYRIRVVDEAGAAVPGGRVQVDGWDHAAVDAEGNARMTLRVGEQVAYFGDGLDSASVPAPETGDEIVLVATPLAEVVLHVVSTGILPRPEGVRVSVAGPRGVSVTTHSLSADTDTDTLRVGLRGMRGASSVRVSVSTSDGHYAGSADAVPDGDPVRVVLAPTD